MWLILNDAFLSVVDFDAAKDPQKRENPDKQLLLCRARRREDLERTFERVGITPEIMDRAGADYSFGAVITRADLKLMMAAQIDDIDYTNFKNSVKENDRHSVYSACWTALSRLQARAPWSGGKSWTSYRDARDFVDGPLTTPLFSTPDDDLDPRGPRGGGQALSGGGTRYGYDDTDYLDRLERACADDPDRPAVLDGDDDPFEARLDCLDGAQGYRQGGHPEDKAFNDGLTRGYRQGALAAFEQDEDGTGWDNGFEEGFAAGEAEAYEGGFRAGYRKGTLDEVAAQAARATKAAKTTKAGPKSRPSAPRTPAKGQRRSTRPTGRAA